MSDTRCYELERKYFKKWSQSVLSNKELNIHNEKYNEIDEFIKRLLVEKTKLTQKSNDFKENHSNGFKNEVTNKESGQNVLKNGYFHYRYQAQKNIIALQKVKLEEQRRYIEELKLNKIVQDASNSVTLISEVKTIFNSCNRNLKPKMKMIIGDISSNDNDASSINSDNGLKVSCMKVPKFFQRMEQRAREREEKRALVLERRRQIELERERIKEQMELERQLLHQEEREKRLLEFKERRKQEQLIAIRKKEFRDKMRTLIVMADLFYEKTLLEKYGRAVLKEFILKVKEDEEKAKFLYENTLIKNTFVYWKNLTKNNNKDRNDKADNLYNNTLKITVFKLLKKIHREMIYNMLTAEDWYNMTLTCHMIKDWKDITKISKEKFNQQWLIAVKHYEWQIKWRYIGYWQKLPIINTLERKQEVRKQKWRVKVQEILPDFIPRIEN